MLTIGITGGIASGKSAVCNIIHPFPLIDADVVSREVVAPGTPGLAQIVEAFGDKALKEDGSLNRARLRWMLATTDGAKEQLEAILHPLIAQAIMDKLQAIRDRGSAVAFVDAALMLETGSYKNYDAVILVTAPKECRLKRLMERDDMTEAAALKLMEKQWPDEKKRELANAEIVNDADLDTLRRRTWAVLNHLIPSLI